MSNAMSETAATASGKPELLFVDDDPMIVESLSLALEPQYQVYTAGNRKQARDLLQRLDQIPPLALIDLGLPPVPHSPEQGFELIHELIAFNSNIKILVLSGQNESGNIQHALTLGAVDFIPKPCDLNLLKARLDHQLMMFEAERAEAAPEAEGEPLMGESPIMATLRDLITQYADTPFPVLIEGESGSGKELVARSLHDQSPRAGAPFLTINCAAFSPELLEAQLFGHAKGAYTGATSSKSGFFEDAGQGSLFLDEVGDLPLNLQSKLLRVLENGEYYRLGETQPRYSEARIIAATNRDLREEVRAGRFRQDLYHRLSVLNIHVPPLRDREKDCLLLLDHFKRIYAVNNAAPFELSREAVDCLLDYTFPGNVRELRNIAIRLCAKHAGKEVGVEELRSELETAITDVNAPGGMEVEENIRAELMGKNFRLENRLSDMERNYIAAALDMSGGNLSKAARLLGINRTTLYSRLQRLGIN
ncbi:MAG: sigma-54 dependent transcriptional regulator [Gammaproteobacteria bacterium]